METRIIVGITIILIIIIIGLYYSMKKEKENKVPLSMPRIIQEQETTSVPVSSLVVSTRNIDVVHIEYYKLIIDNDPDDYKNYWVNYNANGAIVQVEDDDSVRIISIDPLQTMDVIFNLSGGIRLTDESLKKIREIRIKPETSLQGVILRLLDKEGNILQTFPIVTTSKNTEHVFDVATGTLKN